MKNKILKRTIAAALSLGVLASACTVSFAAAVREDASTELFADDFESYTAAAVSQETMSKWYMKDGYTGCEIIEDNGSKVLKISPADGTPVLAMKQGTVAPKIENTPVKISFDVKAPNTDKELWGLICPVMEESSNIEETDFGKSQMIQIKKTANTDDTRIEIYNTNTEVAKSISIVPDTWYTVVLEENLGSAGNWTYIISVFDASGKMIDSCCGSSGDYMGTFQNINFTAWGQSDYHVDNLKIDKISRGLLISDDMGYSSREEASKYWKITDSNSGFEKIDDEHSMSAKVAGGEFTPCVAAQAVETGMLNIEFDTYLSGNTEGTDKSCGRFNVLPQGMEDMGGNTIISFNQRKNDANVDLYVGDSWINQCPTGWYRVRVILDFDNSTYTVSVIDTQGNNYCSGNANAINVTTRAISNLAAINFTTWGDPFYFDNLKVQTISDPCVVIKSNANEISIKKNITYTGAFTAVVGVFSGDSLMDAEIVNSADLINAEWEKITLAEAENRVVKVFIWEDMDSLIPVIEPICLF